MSIICTILFIGDSQGYIDPFSHLVNTILENESPMSTIVHLGDIFDESIANDQQQIDQINRLQNYFSTIVVRGNHDPLDTFNNNFAQLPYVVNTCENVSIIAIDSNAHKMRQLNFIKEQIDGNPNNRFIVVLHHHLQACSTGDITQTFWKAALENTLRPQDLVVHGHSHTDNSYLLSNGTLVLSTSSANTKRYRCIPDNECNCSSDSRIGYLKVQLIDDQWEYNRIYITD